MSSGDRFWAPLDQYLESEFDSAIGVGFSSQACKRLCGNPDLEGRPSCSGQFCKRNRTEDAGKSVTDDARATHAGTEAAGTDDARATSVMLGATSAKGTATESAGRSLTDDARATSGRRARDVRRARGDLCKRNCHRSCCHTYDGRRARATSVMLGAASGKKLPPTRVAHLAALQHWSCDHWFRCAEQNKGHLDFCVCWCPNRRPPHE